MSVLYFVIDVEHYLDVAVIVFERRAQIVYQRFLDVFQPCVTRPVLTNDNLIEYGIENEDDLEFFRKLNEFKKSLQESLKIMLVISL